LSAQPAQKKEVDAIIDRLLAIEDAAHRTEWVAQHPTVDWDEIVKTLTERVWQEVRVDTHRAERLADLAVEVAEQSGNPLSLAKGFRAKANALYALDHHAAAIEFHERAVALFEQQNDKAELARTLSGSIQPLLLLGRYDEALAAGERGRAIFQEQGNTRRLARLEINIGNVYHRQDRFFKSRETHGDLLGWKSISATCITVRIGFLKHLHATNAHINSCWWMTTLKVWQQP